MLAHQKIVNDGLVEIVASEAMVTRSKDINIVSVEEKRPSLPKFDHHSCRLWPHFFHYWQPQLPQISQLQIPAPIQVISSDIADDVTLLSVVCVAWVRGAHI